MKTNKKDLWIQYNDEFNYQSRYFDMFESSNTNYSIVFVEVDESGPFKVIKTTHSSSLLQALNTIEDKTKINISFNYKLNLEKLIDSANKNLNNKNTYFAIKFH